MTDILKYKSHLIPLVLYILSWHLISKAKKLTPLSGIENLFYLSNVISPYPLRCFFWFGVVQISQNFSWNLVFSFISLENPHFELRNQLKVYLLPLTFPWTPKWAKVDAVTSMFPELLTYSCFIAYKSPFHLSQCSADTGTWFVSGVCTKSINYLNH